VRNGRRRKVLASSRVLPRDGADVRPQGGNTPLRHLKPIIEKGPRPASNGLNKSVFRQGAVRRSAGPAPSSTRPYLRRMKKPHDFNGGANASFFVKRLQAKPEERKKFRPLLAAIIAPARANRGGVIRPRPLAARAATSPIRSSRRWFY